MIDRPETPENRETPENKDSGLASGLPGPKAAGAAAGLGGIDRAARTIAQADLDDLSSAPAAARSRERGLGVAGRAPEVELSTLSTAVTSPSAEASEPSGTSVIAASGPANPVALLGAAELTATSHVNTATLWRFMVGGLTPADMRLALQHLLQGCARCQEMARTVWNLTPAAADAFRVRLPLTLPADDTRSLAGAVDVAASTVPSPASAAVPNPAQIVATASTAPVPIAPVAPVAATSAAGTAAPGGTSDVVRAAGATGANTANAANVANTANAENVAASADMIASTGAGAGALEEAGAPGCAAPSGDGESYDAVLDRVFSRITVEEAAVEAARRRAGMLYEELLQHPPARQQLLVHNSARFRDRMLCEALVTASHDEGFRNPARAHQLAGLAVAIAERLSEANAGPEISAALRPNRKLDASGFPLATPVAGSRIAAEIDLLAAVRVRAWAQLGNALRIAADYEGAAVAFEKAEALMASSPTIGQLDKARVLDLEASLRKDQRQLAEAGRLLDRVIAIYRRLGQSNLLGRALNQKALVLGESGDTQGSMTLLRRALDLLDPQEDPRWFLTVRHNLICALVGDGRPREAFALLFHTRPLYLKMGDRMNLLRLRWLEGAVAQGLSRLDQAEAAFREVRDAFVDLGLDYDSALVTLDLAAVFAQQGRTSDMRRLAQEMMVFFESHQIHREAMAAFLVFCNAARMEQAGLGLVREIAVFLKQARNAPDLRFSPRS